MMYADSIHQQVCCVKPLSSQLGELNRHDENIKNLTGDLTSQHFDMSDPKFISMDEMYKHANEYYNTEYADRSSANVLPSLYPLKGHDYDVHDRNSFVHSLADIPSLYCPPYQQGYPNEHFANFVSNTTSSQSDSVPSKNVNNFLSVDGSPVGETKMSPQSDHSDKYQQVWPNDEYSNSFVEELTKSKAYSHQNGMPSQDYGHYDASAAKYLNEFESKPLNSVLPPGSLTDENNNLATSSAFSQSYYDALTANGQHLNQPAYTTDSKSFIGDNSVINTPVVPPALDCLTQTSAIATNSQYCPPNDYPNQSEKLLQQFKPGFSDYTQYFQISDPTPQKRASSASEYPYSYSPAQESTTGNEAPTCTRNFPPVQPLIPIQELTGYTGNGPIQLWQFLLEILCDPSCKNLIIWTGETWQFKMVDPDEVARRWGLRKNKPKMTYEKLSRGIRYYYDKGIIIKCSGRRYVYKFINDLDKILGYSSSELHKLMGITTLDTDAISDDKRHSKSSFPVRRKSSSKAPTRTKQLKYQRPSDLYKSIKTESWEKPSSLDMLITSSTTSPKTKLANYSPHVQFCEEFVSKATSSIENRIPCALAQPTSVISYTQKVASSTNSTSPIQPGNIENNEGKISPGYTDGGPTNMESSAFDEKHMASFPQQPSTTCFSHSNVICEATTVYT